MDLQPKALIFHNPSSCDILAVTFRSAKYFGTIPPPSLTYLSGLSDLNLKILVSGLHFSLLLFVNSVDQTPLPPPLQRSV